MYSIVIEQVVNSSDLPIRIPLNMGTGSPIFKVIKNEGVFVDRGFDPILSEKEIQDELNVTLWASKHGFGPKVFSSDKTHIEMKWIDGKHHQDLSLDQIADLVAVFKNMHSTPIPENISLPKRSHYLDKFLDMCSQMEKNNAFPDYLIKIRSKLLIDLKDLEDTNSIEKLVLCHCDIHANNVIWTKDRLFFIDWTCAGLDFPILDLAVSSMFWNFDMSQDKHLLKSYFGVEPNERDVRRLTLFKNYARINWAMWPMMKVFADYPEKVKDLKVILETRFKKPASRKFEEYRLSLFHGTFKTLVSTFDDWIDLHIARIQASDIEMGKI